MVMRLVLCVCAALLLISAAIADVPQLINYQGRLTSGGTVVTDPVDVVFAIWDADVDGDSLWSEEQHITPDANGAFITLLGSVSPIPDSAFSGPAYLSIKVETDPEMSPRAQIVSVGYAYRVGSLAGAAGGGITGNIIVVNPTGDSTIIGADQIVIRGAGGDEDQVYCSSSGISVTDQNGDVRINISIDEDGPGITLYESSALARGGQDTGARKVEFREGGVLLYGTSDADTVCHLLPDGSILGRGQLTMGTNSSADGDWSNVLGYNNSADGDSATVSGGYDNSAAGYVSTISGGALNSTAGFYSTVSGGYDNFADTLGVVGGGVGNTAGGLISVVGGGNSNVAGGGAAVICGGYADTALGDYSVIGGGLYNKAAGAAAVVPGGSNNWAAGGASFAAGRYARVDHDKTFVWNDGGSNGAIPFSSTDTRQFLINAGNGVGINTDSPTRALQVGGSAVIDDTLFVDEAVGIGTTSPDAMLQVNGAIRLGGGANEYEINEELNTDSDPWDSYISNGGIAIGSNSGTDRQRFIFADGSTTNQIFVVATSQNSGSSWQADFIIQQDGKVGIGTTGPSYPLDVNGDIECTTLHETSDARFKSDITPISDALATVGQLRGVTHTWNREDYPARQFDDKAHLGFLAQEIQQIVPELVSPDANGFLAVDYSHMAPLLVEAIKELNQKTNEIDELKTQLKELQARMNRMQSERH